MKHRNNIFFSLLLILFFAALGFIKTALFPATVLAAGSITATYPAGGEQFTVGEAVHITWTTDVALPCSIYYVDPNDLNTAYFIGNVNNGTVGYIDWTAELPSGINSPMQEKISIACYGAPQAYSNVFTVNPLAQTPTPSATETPTSTPTNIPTPTPTPAIVAVTYPTGGEQFTVGDAEHITWNTNVSLPCSIYYVDPNDPYTYYSIGNVTNGTIGTMDWAASLPSGINATTEEVILISCYGAPAAYSNVFTVNPFVPSSTPTATPTPTTISSPTPTNTPTPTPALVISNITITGVTKDKGIVQWATTPHGTSRVIYGTSPDNLNSTSNENTALSTTHKVNLNTLQRSTTYYFEAVSRPIVGGTEYFSSLNSFRTLDH